MALTVSKETITFLTVERKRAQASLDGIRSRLDQIEQEATQLTNEVCYYTNHIDGLNTLIAIAPVAV